MNPPLPITVTIPVTEEGFITRLTLVKICKNCEGRGRRAYVECRDCYGEGGIITADGHAILELFRFAKVISVMPS